MILGLSATAASAAHAGSSQAVAPVTAVDDPAGILPHQFPADSGGDDADGSAGNEMSAQSTRQFTVTNMSGHTLRLGTVFGTEGWPQAKTAPTYDDDSWPLKGTILAPGTALTFEVHAWGVDHGLTAVFNDVNTADSVTVYMTVSTILRYSDAKSTFGPVTTDGGNIVIQDKPGTTFTYGPGQGQAQAEVLRKVCALKTATCDFQATKQDRSDASKGHFVLGPWHQRGYAIGNITSLPQESEFTETDKVQLTNSISLSIGSTFTLGDKLLSKVEYSVQTTFQTSLMLEHEFKRTEKINIPAGEVGWIMVQQPVVRDTGDFTITMKNSNTTWILKDVTFESPDPQGNGKLLKLARPMTAAERAEAIRNGGVIPTVPDALDPTLLDAAAGDGIEPDGGTVPVSAAQFFDLDGLRLGA